VSQLKITLIKSPISSKKKHVLTVKALGLRKIGQTVIHPDNPCMRGMVTAVRHMVTCEEVE